MMLLFSFVIWLGTCFEEENYVVLSRVRKPSLTHGDRIYNEGLMHPLSHALVFMKGGTR